MDVNLFDRHDALTVQQYTVKIVIAGTLILFPAVVPLSAEEPLRLEDCLRLAARNNPDLYAAEASVRKARMELYSSYGNFLPHVTADAGISDGESDSASGTTDLDDTSIGLSLEQPLFTGFRNFGTSKQKRAALESAEATLTQTQADVAFAVRRAFAQLLFAQEQVALAQAIHTRRQDNVSLVELRYEAGREHKGSFLRIQASERQASADLAKAKRAIAVARQQLAAALGNEEPRDSVVQGTFATISPITDPDLDALTKETPAYRQAAAGVLASRAALTIAQSSFLPEVSATGTLARRGTDWPPRNDRWLAGVEVSLPLFAGGQNMFDRGSAKAELARVEAVLKSVAQQTRFDLSDTYVAYADAIEDRAVEEQFLEAAEVRAEIAQGQYTSGLLSFENWDIIENDLIDTQKIVLASRRDAVIAEADWERVQGKGSIP